MAEVRTSRFKASSEEAIADSHLQGTLKGLSGFDDARREAIDELGPMEWEELRERGRQIKAHTIANLDYYLEMAYERVIANGGQVHFARDASEATNIVTEIATSRGLKVATKSKSMVSEEMGLNQALMDAGVEAVETDLGEYIIQLADETPSHIIAPAIHKTKEDVAQLFAEKIDRPGLTKIEDMAGAARETLRTKFLQADLGITGANFIVAETGTLVIVTNEGNGRFCTSTPRVHIALTGMEKVIPSLDDLSVFLRLLPRAATGQRMSSYVTLVSGPKRSEDEDGPEEFHLVIVNNGRSRLLEDEDLREALNCIRCGACLNICPVYQKIGGHAYGWVYPGPIGAVISPMMVGMDQAKDLPFASTLCGACRDVCPVKINIPRLLLKLRSRLAEKPRSQGGAVSAAEKFSAWGYQRMMSGPRMLGLARRLGRLAQRPFVRNGLIRRIPFPPFSIWTKSRDLPAMAPKPFRQLWKERLSRDR